MKSSSAEWKERERVLRQNRSTKRSCRNHRTKNIASSQVFGQHCRFQYRCTQGIQMTKYWILFIRISNRNWHTRSFGNGNFPKILQRKDKNKFKEMRNQSQRNDIQRKKYLCNSSHSINYKVDMLKNNSFR